MTFVALALIQFFKAYNYRSDRRSVLRRPFANRWLNLAILWELALLAAVVYLPFLHGPFGTFSLPPVGWPIVVGGWPRRSSPCWSWPGGRRGGGGSGP